MAILMPSAAVPWIGMLIAIRSPAERSAQLRAVELRQVAPPPEQRRHEALVAGQRSSSRGVAADPRVGARSSRRCSAAASSRGIVQPLRRGRYRVMPVGDAEVDHLRLAAALGGRPARARRRRPRRRSRGWMSSCAREGGHEPLVAGDVREDAQLDLRVVGAEQQLAGRRARRRARMRRPSSVRIGMFWRFGSVHERRPVAATACCRWCAPGRLGIRPASAARRRRSTSASRPARCSRISVDHLVLVAELLEDRCVRRAAGPRPLRRRQPELVEQHRLELARRADVELVPDQLVDPRLEAGELRGRTRRASRPAQSRRSPRRPVSMPRQHGQERHLDLVEEVGERRPRPARASSAGRARSAVSASPAARRATTDSSAPDSRAHRPSAAARRRTAWRPGRRSSARAAPG